VAATGGKHEFRGISAGEQKRVSSGFVVLLDCISLTPCRGLYNPGVKRLLFFYNGVQMKTDDLTKSDTAWGRA
jgi:hypothetical protein